MFGRALQRIHDLIEMPLRIGLGNRIPDCFFAEDTLAVDDRRDLPVASAQIKSEAATVQMASERFARRANRWNLRDVHDLKGAFVNSAAHDLRVKLASRGLPIMPA